MIEIKPFKAEHMKFLLKEGITDSKAGTWLTSFHADAIQDYGGHYSVLEDQVPVACGGIYKYWENRGEAWLLFGKPKAQSFLTIFKAVDKFIKESPIKRIEMVIDHEFEQGHRWARLLGFKKEAECLKCYRPEGGDVSLYAKVRE